MFTAGDPTASFFSLVLCLVVTAVLLFALYWVIRIAVRDALADREKRRPQ